MVSEVVLNLVAVIDDAVTTVTQQPILVIITAAGSLAGLLTAIALLLSAIPKLRRTEKRIERTERKIDTVHTIVNQQQTDYQRYQIALIEIMKKAGLEIPIDQSKPVTGVPDARPGEPKG